MNSLLRIALVTLVIPLSSWPTSAQTKPPPQLGGKSEMNDIKFSTYDEFWDKWKLVTVRYRKDTQEQRFVYANPAALKALKERTDFPDGAVLGKVGFSLASDPAFESSSEPQIIKRIQLMVRNKDKYKETDGWGYALFDATRRTFNEDPQATTVACHACHKLVPDRDFVFSRQMNFFDVREGLGALPLATALHYEDLAPSDIPIEARKRLPKNAKTIRSMTGGLRKFLFQGTLDEIRPSLIVQSLRSGHPAILMSEDRARFSVVWKAEKRKICAGQTQMTELTVVQTQHGNDGTDQVHESNFCVPNLKDESR